MATIADKLRTILNIKLEIKQAIIDKGVKIEDNEQFAIYPVKILEIQGGSGKSLNRKELMRRIYILSK